MRGGCLISLVEVVVAVAAVCFRRLVRLEGLLSFPSLTAWMIQIRRFPHRASRIAGISRPVRMLMS